MADGWIEIASNDDSPAGHLQALLSNIILPQTAKYLIAVSRYGLERETTIGTFTITLTARCSRHMLICTGHTTHERVATSTCPQPSSAVFRPAPAWAKPTSRQGGRICCKPASRCRPNQPVTGTIGGDSHRYIYIFAGQEDEHLDQHEPPLRGT